MFKRLLPKKDVFFRHMEACASGAVEIVAAFRELVRNLSEVEARVKRIREIEHQADERLHGILSLASLREVPQEKWQELIVRDVMEPIDESLFITVRASIEHARRKLKMNSLGFLAVIDQDGLLVGHLNAKDLEIAA